MSALASPELSLGAVLHLDIERLAHDQLHSLSDEERVARVAQLTERWQGTQAAFHILDGGVPLITHDGEIQDLKDIRGTIESVSVPGGGGGVEVKLDDGNCILLSIHGTLDDAPEDCPSGWTSEVSTDKTTE